MLTTEPAELIDALRDCVSADHTIEGWIDQCRELTMQDPDRGVPTSAKLVELAEKAATARIKARALSAQCHALSYAGKLKQAIAIAERAIEQAEHSADEGAIAEACLTAVQSHNLLGLREEALQLASRAGETFERLGDRDRAATAIMLAGVVLRMLDRPGDALARFDSALELLSENPSLRSQLASNRAEALLDLGRYAEAKASFEAAADGFRSCNQTFGVAIVEGNLADLASRRGELREALGLFLSASEKFRRADDEPEAARLEAEASELFLSIGDTREALTRLPRAIRTLSHAGMQTEHVRALATLGIALERDGQIEQAIEALKQAEAFSAAHDQPQAVIRARSLMGAMLLRQGRQSEAVEQFALALGDKPLAPSRARLLLDLARAYLATGQLALSATSLAESNTIADDLGLSDLEAERHAIACAIARESGNHGRARSALDAALASVESRRSLFAGDRLRAAALGGRAVVFDEGIRFALATKDAHLALRVAETATARSLGERLGTDSQCVPDPALRQIEGDIAATLAAIESARSSGRGDAHIAKLRAQLREQEVLSARSEIRSDAPTQPGRSMGPAFDPHRLVRSIPENAAAVVIASVGDAFARITIASGDTTLKRLGLTQKDAAHLIASLMTDIDRALVRLTLGRPVSPALDRRITDALENLGSALLGDLEGELNAVERIVLVLPASLSKLPVAALRVNGRYLVERCTLALAPSLTWAMSVHSMKENTREGFLAVGVPDELTPSITTELDEIARTNPGAQILRDQHASLQSVRALAANASTVHLACHAEYSPADPMGSRLRLADGWVSGRHLAEFDLSGADVVLGGCETGSVESAHTGEQFGLIRATLIAGARSVIASRWRLSDSTAAALFAELHDPVNLKRDDLICRLSEIQSKAAENAQHPALWGGLYAIGSWR